MPNRDKVASVSCSYNFTMMLTVHGHLFSFGEQNSNGELGLGHTNPVATPSEIGMLSQERIIIVSCGLNHTIALTHNHKVYTWGKNSQGQLGCGDYNDRYTPVMVGIRGAKPMGNFPRQIAAGPSQSIVLTEDAELWWWGNNSRIKKQCRPLRHVLNSFMDAESKNNVEDPQKFCPVNIECSWSKTMSVCTLVMADLRYMDEVKLSKRLLVLKTLIGEISKQDDAYDVPYNNIYSQYLHAKDIEAPAPKNFKKETPLPFEKVQKLTNPRKPDPQPSTSRHSHNIKSVHQETAPAQILPPPPPAKPSHSSPSQNNHTMRSPTPNKNFNSKSPTKHTPTHPMVKSPQNPSSLKKTYSNLQTSPARVLGLTHASPNRRGQSSNGKNGKIQKSIMEESEGLDGKSGEMDNEWQ
jgi:hypothetical protein